MSATLLPNNAMTFTENQHGNVVLEKLKQQREMLRCCDVIIDVDGEKYHAHRCVLAACSPFFDSLFKASKTVKEQLTISTDSPDVFRCLLAYMYTGTVIVDTKNVSELLKLANKLLLLKLKDHCAEYLERYLDTSNCLTILDMANKFNLVALRKTVCKLIYSQLTIVIQGPEILELPPGKLEKFIKNPEWSLSQIETLRLITDWVHYSSSAREGNMLSLLTLNQWCKISMVSIIELINEHALYSSPKACYFLFEVLENNKMLPEQFRDNFLKLNAVFSQPREIELDNNQFLKMAVSTAIDELEISGSLIRSKDIDNDTSENEIPLIVNDNLIPACQKKIHQYPVGSPKFEHFINNDAELRPSDSAFHSSDVKCRGRIYEDSESIASENMNCRSSEEMPSESYRGDKYSAYQREKNKKEGYEMGVNLSNKLSSINYICNSRFVGEAYPCERNLQYDSPLGFQDNMKPANVDPNYSTAVTYDGQMEQFYSFTASSSECQTNRSSQPNSLTSAPALSGYGCDLGEILDLHKMNAEDQDGMIQAIHDLEISQENTANNSDLKGTIGFNTINPDIFNDYSTLDCPIVEQEANSPQDMSIAPSRNGQDFVTLDKNLEAFEKCSQTINVENNFMQGNIKDMLLDLPQKGSDATSLNDVVVASDGTLAVDKLNTFDCKLKRFKWCTTETKASLGQNQTYSTVCATKNQEVLPSRATPKDKPILLNEEKQTRRECDICKNVHETSKEFFSHMKSHFPGPPHHCDMCELKYSRIYYLLDHRRSHSEDKPFKCSDCDFTTRRLFNLREHRTSHIVEKSFKCTECSASFSRKQFLKNHMTKHTSDRPFSCQTCPWTGKTPNSLYIHSKIHSGELYSCQYPNCAYRTAKRSHLKEHMQYHTKSRTFLCSVCSSGFITKSHLRRHLKKHGSDNLLSCPHCAYSCARPDGMKIHIKRKHSSNDNANSLSRKRKLKKKDAILSNSSYGAFAKQTVKSSRSVYEMSSSSSPAAALSNYAGATPLTPSRSFEDPDDALMIASEIEEDGGAFDSDPYAQGDIGAQFLASA